MDNKLFKNIIEQATYNRCFEEKIYQLIENKEIKCPCYLSIGQELISATIANLCKEQGIKPLLFPQHRNHSIYLSFGGEPSLLMKTLMGRINPMQGSASISNKDINMFFHDGLLGSNAAIAVGASFQSNQPTICFLGDSSVEQEAVLASLGWAGTKCLPILFVVEDNNLSILTEKKVRRNWDITEVAKAFNIQAYNIEDNPEHIWKAWKNQNGFCKTPLLLNINTTRMTWHAGAGRDSENSFDRLKHETKARSVEDFFEEKKKEFQKNINKMFDEINK